MTTSGQIIYNPNRDVIIKSALRLIGGYSTGSKPTGDQMEDANEALNLMIKSWQIQGFLWVKEFVTMFTVKDQRIYDLPGANGATSYNQSNLDGALVITDTVLTVNSSAGMAAGDIFGTMLSDNSLDWDTIVSVDSATQVTLTTGLAGAASDNAVVYSYAVADALYRPTRIFHSNRLLPCNSEVPLTQMGRDDYQDLTNKKSEGTPVQLYFDPQLATAKLYLWPVPQNATERIVLSVDRPLQVMIDSSNTADLPEEWIEVIKYGLAVRLAPEYAVPGGERSALRAEYSGLVDNLISYNMDYVSTCLGVDYYG
jgi:hypothetical protein